MKHLADVPQTSGPTPTTHAIVTTGTQQIPAAGYVMGYSVKGLSTGEIWTEERVTRLLRLMESIEFHLRNGDIR